MERKGKREAKEGVGDPREELRSRRARKGETRKSCVDILQLKRRRMAQEEEENGSEDGNGNGNENGMAEMKEERGSGEERVKRVFDKNDGYRNHLEVVLRGMFKERGDFAKLFLEDETVVATNLLERCCETGKALIARLFNRKGPWFRIEQLYRYFAHIEDPDVRKEQVNQAIDQLAVLKLIVPFRRDSQDISVDDAIVAAETALNGSQLQGILKEMKVSLKGCKTKQDFVDALRRASKTQRGLFGKALPIVKFISRAEKDGMVAVPENVKLLLRRAFSLYYLTSSASSFQCNVTVDEGDLTMQKAGGGSFHSPGLLATFKVVKFPTYKLKPETPIFESREHFELYETACAIRTIALNKSEKKLPKNLETETGDSAIPEEEDESDDNSVVCLGNIVANLPAGEKSPPSLSEVPQPAQDFTSFESALACAESVVSLEPIEFARVVSRFLCDFMQWSDKFLSSKVADKPPFFDRFDPGHVLGEALDFTIPLIEQLHDYEYAVSVLRSLLDSFPCIRRRGSWWNRLAVDLKHLGDVQGAREASVACLLDERIGPNSAARVEARTRLKSLLALKGHPDMPHAQTILDEMQDIAKESDVPTKVLFGKYKSKTAKEGSASSSKKSTLQSFTRCEYVSPLDTAEIFCNVEQFVIDHYKMNGGWTGHHCEGSIFRSLFALFMWDAIFYEDIPDVFQTAFQSAPLDLSHSYGLFYQNRRDFIENMLTRINSCSPPELALMVREAWRSHFGLQVCGFRWNSLQRSTLECIAACCGAKLLCSILRRLAMDYMHWCGGGPDLVLYRISTKDGQQIAAKEDVKAEITLAQLEAESGVRNQPKRIRRSDTVHDNDEIAFDASWSYEVLFVEVKSKNDRLSDKQVGWITYLNQSVPDVSFVCKVTDK